MTDQTVTEQTPALWPGALEEARSLIGVELRRHDHQWNTEAAPDSVRHFCYGIGDDNPLFCDPDYGVGTRWGASLAPGCLLYTINSAIVAPKLRGIQWMYGGTRWECLGVQNVPAVPCHSLESLLTDPHLAAVGLIGAAMHPTEGEVRTIRATVVENGVVKLGRTLAGPLGSETRAILEEIGLSAAEIDDLPMTGAVFASGALVETI